MKSNITVEDFSSYLFWDVDTNTFDLEKHKVFLIGRVLELGQIGDWKHLKSYYGLEIIRDVALHLRSLDPVTLSFVSTIFNIDKSEFRCYKQKQSVQNYWNS